MVKSLLIAALLAGIGKPVTAQILIGKAEAGRYEITCDTLLLRKALQRTLGDGTTLKDFSIRSEGSYHYLVATGINKGMPKLIAASIQYNIRERAFYTIPGGGQVTCASAACNACTPFTEKGRIIGCHCAETATVSNHCNFTSVMQGTFHQNLQRAISMKSR
jgi:hypothetical protein